LQFLHQKSAKNAGNCCSTAAQLLCARKNQGTPRGLTAFKPASARHGILIPVCVGGLLKNMASGAIFDRSANPCRCGYPAPQAARQPARSFFNSLRRCPPPFRRAPENGAQENGTPEKGENRPNRLWSGESMQAPLPCADTALDLDGRVRTPVGKRAARRLPALA